MRTWKPVVRRALALGVLAVLVAWLPEAALACSKCFGAAAVESPVTQGITVAMAALIGTTGMVGSGIVLFFVHLNRRARRHEPGSLVVHEDGSLGPRHPDEA